MIESMRLQNAVGAVLDRWGVVLGERRAGRDDVTYRSALFFKVLENVASGSPNDILEITANLFQAESTQIFEYFPASFSLNIVNAANFPDPTFAADLIRSAKPAGVGLLYIAVGTVEPYFAFDGYPADGSLGFDDYLIPGNQGGIFLTAIV
jgi:hypothetical protein